MTTLVHEMEMESLNAFLYIKDGYEVTSTVVYLPPTLIYTYFHFFIVLCAALNISQSVKWEKFP